MKKLIFLTIVFFLLTGYVHKVEDPGYMATETWELGEMEYLCVILKYLESKGQYLPKGEYSIHYDDCTFPYCNPKLVVRVKYNVLDKSPNWNETLKCPDNSPEIDMRCPEDSIDCLEKRHQLLDEDLVYPREIEKQRSKKGRRMRILHMMKGRM
jgi:hypothetical protein